MVKSVRVQVAGSAPVRLDTVAGGSSRSGTRTVALFNAGKCVVGLGGADVTVDDCWRGLGPQYTIIVTLDPGEALFAVAGEARVGEVDVLRVG